jgi:hypothetical protein
MKNILFLCFHLPSLNIKAHGYLLSFLKQEFLTLNGTFGIVEKWKINVVMDQYCV